MHKSYKKQVKLGVKLVFLLCGLLIAYFSSSIQSNLSGRHLDTDDEYHSRRHGNHSIPGLVSFCDTETYPDMKVRLEFFFNSTLVYNSQLKDGDCPIEATDYSLYPVPSVDPCSSGSFILYGIGLFYMFIGLAVVCDEFFVPALEEMVDRFNVSNDVAGATLMAAGGSAPELFTSIMGTFLSKSNVGFGTIVGSAVFNVLFVIAMCALFSKEVLVLTWWPLARDSTYYIFSLSMLAIFYGTISPNIIELWESIVLLAMYVGYVTFMKFNEQCKQKINSLIFKQGRVNPDGVAGSKYKENTEDKNFDNPFLRHSKFRAGVLHMMYNDDDVLDKARVHVVAEIMGDVKSTFSQIDLDHSGYIDSSELGEMLRRLMRIVPDPEKLDAALKVLDESGDGRISLEEFSAWYLKSEERVIADMRKQFDRIDSSGDGVLDRSEVRQVIISLSPDATYTEDTIDEALKEFDKDGDAQINFEEFENWYRKSILWQKNLDIIQDDEESGPLELEWPDNTRGRILFILTLPIVLPLYLTIPDVRRPGKAKLYPVTWFMAIAWIGLFSYFMVWWALYLGDVAGIPSSVMGLTFLAMGTSIPDLLTSVIVARQGFGDMAVSSSIGSNIFDILIGLPLPWFFHNAAIGPITVASNNLLISVIVLVAMLLTVILTIAYNKWRMTKSLGFTMLLLYVVFITQDLLRQFSC